MTNFDEMVLHFLKDMYYAEQSILKSLPGLAAAAQHEGLKRALTQHADETKTQVQRLEQVFAGLGQSAEGVTCEALVGLMQETDDVPDGVQRSGNRPRRRPRRLRPGGRALRDRPLRRAHRVAERQGAPRVGGPPGAIARGRETSRRQAQRPRQAGDQQGRGANLKTGAWRRTAGRYRRAPRDARCRRIQGSRRRSGNT